MGDTMKGAAAKAAKWGASMGAAAAVLGTIKLVSVARSFDVLNAQLITATGSAKNAEKAFAAIQEFAATTPFDVNQVTNSFTKLVNLGLTPSERALTAYGNTASAMGKDLNQLIEAVADAATGEFERLKEFGIKASKQGDKVSFMFRGVKTTVQNSAADIEGYLMGLGEVEFAGAMEQRMNSLDGAISNLGDSFDGLFREISNAGAGELIEQIVRGAIDQIDDLKGAVESGELAASIGAVGARFEGWADDVERALVDINGMLSDESGFWQDFGDEAGDALKEFPNDVRAIIQLAAMELSAFGEIGETHVEAFVKIAATRLASLIDKAAVVGRGIASKLNIFSGEFDLGANIESEFARIDALTGDITDGYIKGQITRSKANHDARRASIEAILGERDAHNKASDAMAAKAEELGAAWRKAREEKAEQSGGEDRLEGFKVGGAKKGGDGESDADKKRVASLRAKYKTESTLKAEHLQRLADIEKLFGQKGYATEREQQQILLEEQKRYANEVIKVRSRAMADAGAGTSAARLNAAKRLNETVEGLEVEHKQRMFEIDQSFASSSESDEEQRRAAALAEEQRHASAIAEARAKAYDSTAAEQWAAGMKASAAEVAAIMAGDPEQGSRLDALRGRYETEASLKEEHLQRLADLETLFAETGFATDQERKQILAEAEQAHADRITSVRTRGMTDLEKFTNSSTKDQTKTVLGGLSDMLSGAAQHSKKAFKAQKAAAIGSALISAYEGISKTMGAYPYPVNVGMAAAHAAGAFAQVNAIRSQSFGGGGGGGGVAASGGGAAPDTSGAASRGVNIDVESVNPDAILSGASVINLGRRMQEAIDDGAFTLTVRT